MQRSHRLSFSFWAEIEMARVGDVEVEVTAATDGEDVEITGVRLNGDEVSDQIGDRNYKILQERAEEEAPSAAEVRADYQAGLADYLYDAWRDSQMEAAAAMAAALAAAWEAKQRKN